MKRYPAGIMATCCVPWTESNAFDEQTFRSSVRQIVGKGTKLVYVFGTAGEGYAVSESQFDQVVDAFSDEMRQQAAEPMVGVIHLSTETILERIRRCVDKGVTQFQISLPCWGAVTDDELFRYFEIICDSFPGCRFMHYNLPRAKRVLTGWEYGRLAELHANLVATKNCGDSMSHIRGLLDGAPQLQHFLSESGYVYGALFGQCSMLASLVINWPRLHALYAAGKRRDLDLMVEIQAEVNFVHSTLMRIVRGTRIDGAYDKIFAKMHDARFPLRLLPPYQGANNDEFRRFVTALHKEAPGWVPDAAPRNEST